jgi:predicted NBD/HSP70 family sugar kinase
MNAAATLRALRRFDEPVLRELARQTGLSRPTTEAVVAQLVARGLAEEVAPRPDQRLGRPARRFRFRAEAGLALGIEIDARRVVLFLSYLDGRVVASHRAELDPAAGRRERLAAVRAAVRSCLRDASVARGALWAVAIGTPGMVDSSGRITSCTVVPDWAGVDLARELGRSFSCPILVDNDANLAAVAERWRGVAADVDDAVYVLAGLHTGAGIILGGRLRRGRFGAAGEVGVLPELGWRDTTAALAGSATLTRSAGHASAKPAPVGAGAANPDLKGAGAEHRDLKGAGSGQPELAGAGSAQPDLEGAAAKVLAAAEAGDTRARKQVAALATRMARGVAALVLAVDPEMVVVGGALATGPLVDELRRQVRPLCPGPIRIEASTLGDEAVPLGAVRLALDRIDADLYTA